MFEKKAIGSKINNTITSSSEYTNYLISKPTEEWSGAETRNYTNYVRPLRNLFENDSELKDYIKSTTGGLTRKDSTNSVLEGCSLVQVNSKYELKPGVFMNSGRLYHLYPNLKVAERLMENFLNLYANAITEKKLWLSYSDNTFKCEITQNGVVTTYSNTSAIGLMTSIGIISDFDSYKLMPVYSSPVSVYFDKTDGVIKIGTGIAEDTQILNSGATNMWTGFKTDSYTDNSITNNKIADTTSLTFVKGSRAATYDASTGASISSTNNAIVDLNQDDLRNIVQCVTLNTNQNINGSKVFLQDVNVNADIYANNCYSTSSRIYKKDISHYDGTAIDVLNKVDVVNYHYKTDIDGKEDKVGFIAEDTPSILSTTGMNKMDMTNCIGLLIKAVQELSEENKELRGKLDDITSKY